MKATKILVVEDAAIIALEIKARLADFGYQVVGVATRASEALQLALARQPDLVLMDIVLEGETDGVEASARLHEQLGVPVIFLTGHSDTATLGRAAATGSYGYLLKPFRPEELHAAIEVALAKHTTEKRMFARWSELAASLQTANERERSTLAEQLHEQLAQEICAARYAVAALPQRESEAMRAIAQQLEAANRNAAQLADQLRPAHITSGLLPALHKFADTLFEGEDVHWEIAADELWVFEPLATPLFRIAEAALINVKLHSQARQVRVELREDGAHIVLRVSDDGRGFATNQSDKPYAFGFARMQRWVASIGASLAVKSEAGQGTVVEVRLPRQ